MCSGSLFASLLRVKKKEEEEEEEEEKNKTKKKKKNSVPTHYIFITTPL